MVWNAKKGKVTKKLTLTATSTATETPSKKKNVNILDDKTKEYHYVCNNNPAMIYSPSYFDADTPSNHYPFALRNGRLV